MASKVAKGCVNTALLGVVGLVVDVDDGEDGGGIEGDTGAAGAAVVVVVVLFFSLASLALVMPASLEFIVDLLEAVEVFDDFVDGDEGIFLGLFDSNDLEVSSARRGELLGD